VDVIPEVWSEFINDSGKCNLERGMSSKQAVTRGKKEQNKIVLNMENHVPGTLKSLLLCSVQDIVQVASYIE
jgi:hypothetical protein